MAKNILEVIAASSKKRAQDAKAFISLAQIKEMALEKRARHADSNRFLKALKKDGLSFICEIKKASPSKGVISEDFPYESIAQDYSLAGADAVSCLTEPNWFLGSDEIFRSVRGIIKQPMIRKDFTVDEYQIYEAALMGADAILLICSLLDTPTLNRYLSVASEFGMSVLVEAHTKDEIASAVSAGAQIIGVNNRNLKDFSVDLDNAARLRELVPPDIVYVSESGISKLEDIEAVSSIGADAVLIGEYLMRSNDKVRLLQEMRRIAGRARGQS